MAEAAELLHCSPAEAVVRIGISAGAGAAIRGDDGRFSRADVEQAL